MAASPEGQRAFLAEVFAVARRTPRGLGAGVFYWTPEDITAPGHGSAVENLALFDATGNALPAMTAMRDDRGGR